MKKTISIVALLLIVTVLHETLSNELFLVKFDYKKEELNWIGVLLVSGHAFFINLLFLAGTMVKKEDRILIALVVGVATLLPSNLLSGIIPKGSEGWFLLMFLIGVPVIIIQTFLVPLPGAPEKVKDPDYSDYQVLQELW